MRPRWPSIVGAICITLSASMLTRAQGGDSSAYDDLLSRIPAQANVLMFIDIDGMLNSPMAKRDNWRAMLAQNRPDPLGIQGTAARCAVALGMDIATMTERWRLGMLQVSAAVPKLDAIAAREGGYVETVSNMPVIFTPRGVDLFRFTDNIVGFAASVDRQSLVNWIDTTLSKPRKFPPSFADQALFKANNGYQIILAVNLDHVVSPKGLEPWLTAIPEVKKAFAEPKLMAPRLASAKSAYLAIKVDQSISGVIKVEFDQTLDGTSPVLRAIVMNTLEDMGIELAELKTWQISLGAQNKSIEMEGRLSVDSVRKVASIANVPKLAGSVKTAAQPAADAPKTDGGKAEASRYSPPSGSSDPVGATQAYFRAVTAVLASLKSTDRPTYRATKSWYDRYAKQIEELPLLNVDKEVLDWGSLISRTLREMSSGINYYANNQSYTLAQQPNGVYGGYDGYAYNVSSKSYDQAIIKRQSDAMMSVDLDKRWQAIEISTADLRRKLVDKYKVDF